MQADSQRKLSASGLLPFSFSEVDKSDDLRGMVAFYELDSLHVMAQMFVKGHAESVVCSSNMPANLRGVSLVWMWWRRRISSAPAKKRAINWRWCF